MPTSDADWAALIQRLNGGASNPHPLLASLLSTLRDAGARSVLQEQAYIDRDFSAAYAAFYAGLFRPYRKFCRRLHFFSSDVSDVLSAPNTQAAIDLLEQAGGAYLGSVVLRPIDHAPVSSAHLSAPALTEDSAEITVASFYKMHVMGVELSVLGLPLTQQDTRTGACAQATMWMAGRHFNNKHGSPWFSMPNITEIALNPIDSGLTRSLPAGSEWLTPDSMVRALRAMGRHPVMYAPDAVVNGLPTWQNLAPKAIAARYADSGIPVLLGLQKAGTEVGHGVIVVGSERSTQVDVSAVPPGATTAEFLTHLLVNDDQRGAYCRLPISQAGNTGQYPFCLETDVKFLLVPLPAKVFMKAEVAEIIARRILSQVSQHRVPIVEKALGPGSGWNVDEHFYDTVLANALVTRTYLTYGWKYKARALRNAISEKVKTELVATQLPRFVWVSEFSTPAEAIDLNPCKRQVRAHVVVDATGSQFGEPPLILDAPGLSIFWRFDPGGFSTSPSAIINAEPTSAPYWPKIRGRMDYSDCAVA